MNNEPEGAARASGDASDNDERRFTDAADTGEPRFADTGEPRFADVDGPRFADDDGGALTDIDDDDGRTVADMSGIEGRPSFLGSIMGFRGERSRRRGSDGSENIAGDGFEMTKEERRWYILGAMKAGLLIALAFAAGLGLIILLMVLFW